MSLRIGIVGLPNVGKSTIFKALTSQSIDIANYPFCTINPNIGVVEVPDERLAKLTKISHSKKTVPTVIEFVDIAGLVKGASEGEGLGNKFLSHIREVNAIVQVVRAFNDKNIIHVSNRVNPQEDATIINLELALADLQTISRRLNTAQKLAKDHNNKVAQIEAKLFQKVNDQLQAGQPARLLSYTEEETPIIKELQLLTMKPMLYVVNVDDYQVGNADLRSLQIDPITPQILISAKLEAELTELSSAEAREYLKELGITQTGLDKLIIAGYQLLNLITYFTSGEPETRAWTVEKNTKAPQAAGVIHTDFIKGFIKADVAGWQDFIQNQGWSHLRESGKMRTEGKDYIVQDGDVVYFHVSN